VKSSLAKKAASGLTAASGPIVVIALWELATRLGGVDPIFLPAPSTVAVTFVGLILSGELFMHAAYSLGRLLLGYGIAAVSGIGLGLLIGWFRIFHIFFKPLVELIRPISPIALIPLAILWFGIDWESKVFVIAMGTFFPILLNTIAGVRNTDQLMIRAARSLGASNLQILRTVAIPSAAPFIHTGLRISLGIGFIVIIASEMVAAQNGLGWLVLDSQRLYRTDIVFVGIVSVSCLGLLADYGMSKLGQLLFPWMKTKEVGHV
jgi:ABC-type nitrate/sulfonate/bicarbonate transport system permease component